MNVGEYIKQLRTSAKYSQEQLGALVGVKRAAVQKWECGSVQNLKRETIAKLSEIFNVSPVSFIINDANKKSEVTMLDQSLVRSIPVYNSVSAGFGATAIDEVIDYIPLYIKCDYEADNTICINVVGDSMYPKIEDGDKIQVIKQTSVDSGQIAVALIDGEESVVKKVVYGSTWIEFHSFNPMYPVRRFDGAEVQRVQILGLVKKIIKDC